MPTICCKRSYVSSDHFAISQEPSEYQVMASASLATHCRSRKLVHPSAGVISCLNLGPPVIAGLILSLADFEQVRQHFDLRSGPEHILRRAERNSTRHRLLAFGQAGHSETQDTIEIDRRRPLLDVPTFCFSPPASSTNLSTGIATTTGEDTTASSNRSGIRMSDVGVEALTAQQRGQRVDSREDNTILQLQKTQSPSAMREVGVRPPTLKTVQQQEQRDRSESRARSTLSQAKGALTLTGPAKTKRGNRTVLLSHSIVKYTFFTRQYCDGKRRPSTIRRRLVCAAVPVDSAAMCSADKPEEIQFPCLVFQWHSHFHSIARIFSMEAPSHHSAIFGTLSILRYCDSW
jgi:hypothetical protein